MQGSRIGVKYIGQHNGRQSREYGHFWHLGRETHHSPKLQNYFNKYGKESLKFSILMHCSEKELDFWEKWWIKSFDSYKNGFNCNEGGNSRSNCEKECVFQNIFSGEIVKCDSISKFAEKYHVCENMASKLYKGEANYTGEWFNPKFKWRPEFCILISPEGKEYKIFKGKISEFCREHNLDKSSIVQVLLGICQSCRGGWKRPDSRKRGEKHHKLIHFKFIDPNGNLIEGENLKEFTRINNFSISSFSSLLNEEVKYVNGWRKYKDGMELKPFNRKDFLRKRPNWGRVYKFVSPTGEIFETTNLNEFSEQHGLTSPNLSKVWNEKLDKHKGWRKYKKPSI